jgi:hypothetical protein
MKKTYVAVAIAAALLIVLAAAVAILQYAPSQSGSGQLAIMGTDPPVYSEGVRDAQAHYNSVQAHKSGSDQSSGWVQVSGSGTLDLMASGSAQTMATSQVNAGTFDAFRFNSVKVTYNNQDYMATVASTTITAQSQSHVQVNDSSSAAAVVDVRTFVMNTGNSSQPQFVFSATAVATSVPPSALVSISLQVGTTATLSGTWWSDFQARTSTDVNLAATLTANSMVLTMHNSGSANAEVQEVIVTPVSASVFASGTLPSSFTDSAVFTSDTSGSLQSSDSLQGTALLNGGATLASGASTTMNYNGAILMNFGSGSLNVSGVLAGQQYLITVIGANTYTSAVVVAT